MHVEMVSVQAEELNVHFSGYVGDAICGPTFSDIERVEDLYRSLPYYGTELGMSGAAIAMVSTRGIVCVVGCVLLLRRGLMTFGPVRVESIGRIVRIGLPVAVWGVTFSLIYVALARLAAPFGTTALAAMGIGHRVESWLYMASVGVGAAAAAALRTAAASRPGRFWWRPMTAAARRCRGWWRTWPWAPRASRRWKATPRP